MSAPAFPGLENVLKTLALKEIAAEMKREETFSLVETGVYYGGPEKETDLYFNGEGPLRKAAPVAPVV